MNGRVFLFWPAVSFLVFITTHCTREQNQSLDLDLGGQLVTYEDHVKPVIESKCLDCHGSPPRDGAPSNSQYTSFNDVVKWSDEILKQVLDREMPPAEENNALTLDEILLLQRWMDDGFVLSTEDTSRGLQAFQMEFLSLQSPEKAVADTLWLEILFTGYSAGDSLVLYRDRDNIGYDGIAISGKLGVDSTLKVPWRVGHLPSLEKHFIYARVFHEDSTETDLYADSYAYIPLRNAAPNASIISPHIFKAYRDSLLPVDWDQSDVESRALTSSLYFREKDTSAFKPLFKNRLSGETSYLWDVSELLTGSAYTLKLVVTDEQGASFTHYHGPFSIVNGSIPTYIGNVKSIIDFRCNDCHGIPPDVDAPDTFNLTTYDDVVAQAVNIQLRTIEERTMPPEEEEPLTEEEYNQILLWLQTGMLIGESNEPPSIALKGPLTLDTAVGDRYAIRWTASDLDNNALIHLYRLTDTLALDTVLIVSNLREDTDSSYVLQTQTLPARSQYYLMAVIEDGVNPKVRSISPGQVVVEDRNATPTVALVEPVPFQSALDSTLSVQWVASDPDSQELLVSLSFQPDSGQPWQSILESTPVPSSSYAWDVSQLSTGTHYAIRIEVEDPFGLQAVDTVKNITIVNGTVPTYRGVVQSIIELKCNDCHGIPPDVDAPDTFNLTTYDDVVAMAAQIQRWVFEKGDMPPEDQEPLTATEKDQLLLWLQSGMPEGTINIPPTLTFTAPSGEDTATNNSFTITWDAEDLDNNAVINLYYTAAASPLDTVVLAERLLEDSDSQYVVNTSQLHSGSRLSVFGFIYDGVNDTVWAAAPGTIIVEDRNAAPTLMITKPEPFAALVDSTYNITWQVTDPEEDPLTFSLYFQSDSGAAWQPLVENQSIPSQSYLWDVSALESGSRYALRVEAVDPGGLKDADTVYNITVVNGTVPTYLGAIKSIIEFKCNKCHGIPADFEAPDTFNLTTYNDVVAMAEGIMTRTIEERTMPPVEETDLTPEERDALTLWLQSGMPEGQENIAPTLNITAPASGITLTDELFTITWDGEDLDNNAQINLYWINTALTTDTNVIVLGLSEDSVSRYDFNTSFISGNTTLRILGRIYDGVNPPVWSASSGTLTTPDRNTRPSITLLEPAAGDLLTASPATVRWSATDPDGDAFSVSIAYSTDSVNFTMVDSVSNDSTYQWDISGMEFGTRYFLRVVVADVPGNTRDTSQSERFGIALASGEFPNFYATVLPIFEVKCNNCHTSPFENNAPTTFDLSQYGSVGNVSGAADKASQIYSQVFHDIMPPVSSAPLTQYEKEQILLWVEGGALEGQPGVSDVPTLSFTAPQVLDTVVNDRFTVQWTATDNDNDARILLYYDTDNSGFDGILLDSNLYENTHTEYLWNTSSILGNTTYSLYASITDGVNDTVKVYASGSVFVPARNNSTPVITLTSPVGGEMVSDGTVDIQWSASDIDGDNLSIELSYDVSDNNWISIDTVANTGSAVWDASGLSNGASYRIRAVARDPGNLTAEAVSGTFTLHNGTTTYFYNDGMINGFFNAYCTSCHAGRGAPKRLLLDTYQNITQKPANIDKILDRVNVKKDMPPSTEPAIPTAAEREMILDWILGGAPEN